MTRNAKIATMVAVGMAEDAIVRALLSDDPNADLRETRRAVDVVTLLITPRPKPK
jgi:hypothetical protein